jgi:cysteinyl-tRNA synthetase
MTSRLQPDVEAPAEVRELARLRSDARRARDWQTADALRAQIEAAGWKVIDHGTEASLHAAHPGNIDEGGTVRYGSSASVPARFDEAATALATIVLIATQWPDDLARALRALAAHAPAGTQVVVVADDPSAEQEAALGDPSGPAFVPVGGLSPEVIRTSAPLGHGAATNIGLRRAAADVAILLDTSVEPSGDVVTPLVEALEDPGVAVAGAWGIVSDDLRHFHDAPAGDVDAIEGYCLAFRRRDYAARGPLDEHFRFYRNMDIWWSLVLRDEGEGLPPRRALAIDALPLARYEHRGYVSLPEAERERLSRRNFYLVINRFGRRRDLLVRPGTVTHHRPGP